MGGGRQAAGGATRLTCLLSTHAYACTVPCCRRASLPASCGPSGMARAPRAAAQGWFRLLCNPAASRHMDPPPNPPIPPPPCAAALGPAADPAGAGAGHLTLWQRRAPAQRGRQAPRGPAHHSRHHGRLGHVWARRAGCGAAELPRTLLPVHSRQLPQRVGEWGGVGGWGLGVGVGAVWSGDARSGLAQARPRPLWLACMGAHACACLQPCCEPAHAMQGPRAEQPGHAWLHGARHRALRPRHGCAGGCRAWPQQAAHALPKLALGHQARAARQPQLRPGQRAAPRPQL